MIDQEKQRFFQEWTEIADQWRASSQDVQSLKEAGDSLLAVSRSLKQTWKTYRSPQVRESLEPCSQLAEDRALNLLALADRMGAEDPESIRMAAETMLTREERRDG